MTSPHLLGGWTSPLVPLQINRTLSRSSPTGIASAATQILLHVVLDTKLLCRASFTDLRYRCFQFFSRFGSVGMGSSDG